jgi:uncharacterized membrane protein SirB2
MLQSYYSDIKTLHVLFAVLSLSGFLFRGLLMALRSPWLWHPLAKRLPHLNDSLLFVFGLLLLWQGPWSLLSSGWLQLKLLLLLLYIGLGFIALHRGAFTRGKRLFALGGAVSVFLLMLWLAHFKPL